ncbi:tRNA uracil 4-sulfurtransferase ThiI [Salisediminibacterium halotolerans]|uniref:Probable tRNA sulfurtransferase n=1 Tax=Salisediminibacterium halotolerans TaxID=517425 RepID=A0A1H9V7V6_9BACI|nr:tRNA uracil 4-sulfurtransferase ThiI [Salisediminibacterium haloalkalitolerans]SES17343.1 thiamine biosynthesis protein ThiI [Salisediminibacterium haloalkalitolerans]
MKYDFMLIRYAELAIKGKNRKKFEQILEKNIRQALKPFDGAKTSRSFGRIFIELNGHEEEKIAEAIKPVYGIYSFSPAVRSESNEKAMQENALWMLNDAFGEQHGTFKVSVRRTDKTYPVSSQEMNHVIGGYLLRNLTDKSVDVHDPDVEVNVEIREDATYILCKRYEGMKGLPVGSSGKSLLMLSGGLDSPVAGIYALKKGVTLEAVHFHSPPYTNDRAKKKAEDLARVMTRYGGRIKLHTVSFTEIQKAIRQQIPDNYEITVTRRFMLRIAEKIAEETGAKAVVTGESLGQVASQTLESMHAINAVTAFPVLRPLLTAEKLDIVEDAKKFGTHDISTRPYDDCCTIFLPSESKTKPKPEKAARYESWLDIEQFVAEAVSAREIQIIDAKDSGINEEISELF